MHKLLGICVDNVGAQSFTPVETWLLFLHKMSTKLSLSPEGTPFLLFYNVPI